MADNQNFLRFSIFLFQRIRQTGTRGKKELITSQFLTWIASLPSWIATSTLIGNVRSSLAATLTPYKLPLAHVDTMNRPFVGMEVSYLQFLVLLLQPIYSSSNPFASL